MVGDKDGHTAVGVGNVAGGSDGEWWCWQCWMVAELKVIMVLGPKLEMIVRTGVVGLLVWAMVIEDGELEEGVMIYVVIVVELMK